MDNTARRLNTLCVPMICDVRQSAARVEGRVAFDIPYMPHYNTLTETGKANFSRIPDALAELFDNAIQVERGRIG